MRAEFVFTDEGAGKLHRAVPFSLGALLRQADLRAEFVFTDEGVENYVESQ